MSELLILGATGTNGSRLVPLPAAAGHAVRVATRHPERAGLPAGGRSVRFDWDDPSGWPAALTGDRHAGREPTSPRSTLERELAPILSEAGQR